MTHDAYTQNKERYINHHTCYRFISVATDLRSRWVDEMEDWSGKVVARLVELVIKKSVLSYTVTNSTRREHRIYHTEFTHDLRLLQKCSNTTGPNLGAMYVIVPDQVRAHYAPHIHK
jgi:hypothetical protein